MSIWRGGPFFEDDDVTLKGKFESDGIAQVPDPGSGYCTIYRKGDDDPVVDHQPAGITGTIIYYKISDLEADEYVAYLTAKFNNGADERTGQITFLVKKKEGIWC